MEEWISVKDRLPELGERVFVWYKWQGEDNKYSVANDIWGISRGREPHWLLHHNGMQNISHWMPLPKPPKGYAVDKEKEHEQKKPDSRRNKSEQKQQ